VRRGSHPLGWQPSLQWATRGTMNFFMAPPFFSQVCYQDSKTNTIKKELLVKIITYTETIFYPFF